MKKVIFLLFIFTFLIISSTIKIEASDNYLEASKFITASENEDATTQVEFFLEICSKQNKQAKFDSRTYLISNNIILPSNVGLYGDELTLFKGINEDYQINMFDSNYGTSNITIKNIIFDNITIYIRNNKSSNIKICNNIFMNAKKVDVSIDSGLKPDLNNQNGGENTGYYVLLSHNEGSLIKSNIFLRDKDSLGRGVATYSTSNVTIEDNYFGKINDIPYSIVSDETKKLTSKLSELQINLDDNQGYFMTGINVVNYDVNLVIKNNHMSFNTDLFEAQYEDKSYNSKGYHRDHLIYAKGYKNLEIVGNYFKGMNKNADGGVKCRNGEGLLIYKNIFDDVLLLLYVQTGNEAILRNVFASNNIFINRFYTSKKFEYLTNTKYLSIDYLILIKNYVNDSDISNITIINNEIVSNDLKNEEIRLSRINDNDTFNNLNIYDNETKLGNVLNIVDIGATKKEYSELRTEDVYVYDITKYQDINVNSLLVNDEIDFIIKDKKIITSGAIINDNKVFEEELTNISYEFIVYKSSTQSFIIDNVTKYGETQIENVDSTLYTFISINNNFENKNISLEKNEKYHLKNINDKYDMYEISIIEGSNVCKIEDGYIIPLQPGNHDVKISFGGFTVDVKLNVSSLITGIQLSEKEITINENSKGTIDILLDPVDNTDSLIVHSSDESIVEASIINNKLFIISKAAGQATITVSSSQNDEISASICVTVNQPVSTGCLGSVNYSIISIIGLMVIIISLWRKKNEHR